MNQIQILDNNVLTMSSYEISELVESRHDSVRRTIERCAERGAISLPPLVEVKVQRERRAESVEVYQLDKRGSLIVVAQLCPEFTARIVDRWQELEAKASQHTVALPDFSNPAIAARAWADEFEGRQAAIAERDEAVRTKALIGSKREATAMATASAARREADKLRGQLGFNSRHATVIAVEKAIKSKFGKQEWRKLKDWCTRNGESWVKVEDPRWGEAVAWPAGAWMAVHGINLGNLFGSAA